MERECKKHGLTEYIINSQNKKICKKCRVENSIKHRQNLKEKAIQYKGGCCVLCGYNKCIQALEFHHLDPNEKDFTISETNSIGWEKLKKEIDKCILVCANCHREIHWGVSIHPN
jgi:hypothetical protein